MFSSDSLSEVHVAQSQHFLQGGLCNYCSTQFSDEQVKQRKDYLIGQTSVYVRKGRDQRERLCSPGSLVVHRIWRYFQKGLYRTTRRTQLLSDQGVPVHILEGEFRGVIGPRSVIISNNCGVNHQRCDAIFRTSISKLKTITRIIPICVN